jgi:hypothetical protein
VTGNTHFEQAGAGLAPPFESLPLVFLDSVESPEFVQAVEYGKITEYFRKSQVGVEPKQCDT